MKKQLIINWQQYKNIFENIIDFAKSQKKTFCYKKKKSRSADVNLPCSINHSRKSSSMFDTFVCCEYEGWHWGHCESFEGLSQIFPFLWELRNEIFILPYSSLRICKQFKRLTSPEIKSRKMLRDTFRVCKKWWHNYLTVLTLCLYKRNIKSRHALNSQQH